MIGVVMVAVYALIGILLARSFGPVYGLVLYATATSLLTLIASVLLTRSNTDTVTWKNHLAGLCLPWSSFVGGGPLSTFLIKSQLASIAFSATVVFIDHVIYLPKSPRANPTNIASGIGQRGIEDPGFAVEWLTFACWIITFAIWVWLLRSFFGHQSDAIKALALKRGILVSLTLPVIILACSFTLKFFNHDSLALAIVALPLLVVFLLLSLVVSVVLFCQFIGKPIRWN